MILDIKTPRVFEPALSPARYIGIWGGRGSGKSHFFAELMIERCISEKINCVCIREVQKSLNQSVKKLLENKIESLGVSSLFEIQEAVIKGLNGSEIRFVGMQSTTADSVKSMEGVDIAWTEESQSLSQRSIDLLRPTIRKPGSQIWFSWNPDLPTDPVDVLLRGTYPPPNAIIVKANYQDNPWFPDVLQEEMEYDRMRDPDKYAHVWLGEYRSNSESRVFKNWIIEDFERPKGTIFRFGADFGFAIDPTVLVRGSVEGNRLYVDYEAVMVGCEIVSTPDLFRRIPESDKWFIIADSARPETISYLRNNGFPKINPAKKGKGSINDGVEFMRSYDIVVHPRCVELIKELTLYSYKTDPLTGAILPVFQDKNNHCIAEGSLVTTIRGDIPIEHVVVGDYALTREGYKRVLFSGVTDINREVLKVEATHGDVYCTPDHKIWTENRGFVKADTLRYNDEIISIKESSWLRQFKLNTMEKLITAIQKVKGDQIEFTLKDQPLEGLGGYIGKFGNIIMGKYQKAIISTIKMKIHLITKLITLNVYLQKIISELNTSLAQKGLSYNGNTLTESGHSQKHGTQANKVLHGTNKMEQSHISHLFQLLSNAYTVAKTSIQRNKDIQINSAQTNVKQPQELKAELIMSKEFALVEKSLQQTNIPKSKLVVGHVLTITSYGLCERVYDLTIEDKHEFFANGILVHNCIDSVRYMLEGIRHMKKKNRSPQLPSFSTTVSGMGY